MKPLHPCGVASCPTLVRTPRCKRGHSPVVRDRHGACVACLRVTKAAYRKSHPESKRAEDARRYVKKAPRIRARVAAYRQANPGKLQRKDRDYAKANPAIRRSIDLRRKARKKFAPGRGITAGEFQSVISGTVGICSYCNGYAPLELDHIEPVSKGGAHDIENATPACRPCNSTKSDTPLLLWLATRVVRAA